MLLCLFVWLGYVCWCGMDLSVCYSVCCVIFGELLGISGLDCPPFVGYIC